MALAVVNLGLSVGFIALSLLLRPKPEDVEGNRLEDSGVTTSGYNSYLTKALGTPRQSGETFWVFNNEFTEIKHTQKVGGKGGGSSKQTSFTYTSSFACSFGEGVAVRIRRLWLNAKLVYDVNGEIPIKEGLEFRFYTGAETQLPDPLMQSDIDVRIGPNSTPAYRGQPYILFVDLSLEDYGRALPNVEAEIEYGVGSTALTGTEVSAPSHNWLVTDLERGRLYAGGDDNFNAADDYLVMFTDPFSSAQTVNQDFDVCGIDENGNIFGSNAAKTENKLVEPFTGTTLKSNTTGIGSDTTIMGKGVKLRLKGELIDEALYVTLNRDQAFGGQDMKFVNVLYHNDPDFGVPHTSFSPHLFADDQRFSTIVTEYDGNGVAWNFSHNNTTGMIQFYKYEITGVLSPALLGTPRTGFEITEIAAYTANDIDGQGGGVVNYGSTLAFDPSDKTIVGFLSLNSPTRAYIFKWSEDEGFHWLTSIPSAPSTTLTQGIQHSLIGQHMGWAVSGGGSTINISTVNLSDGTIVVNAENTGIIANASVFAWDDLRKVIYVSHRDASSSIARIRVGASTPQGVTWADIISRVCTDAGLSTSEFDVTGVSGITGAWTNDRLVDGVTMLSPILSGRQIDAFTDANKLFFKDRGGATVGTILEEELLLDPSSGNNRTLEPSIVEEEKLPETVTISYRNQNKDHLADAATFKRIRLPQIGRTINTQGTVTISLPVSDVETEMRAMAVKKMGELWNQREVYQASAPLNFIEYLPGDALLLQRENGTIRRVRVVEMPFGADYTIKVTLIAEKIQQYTASIPADAGSYQGQIIPYIAPSEVMLLNSTILRDVDATDRSVGRHLWTAGPKIDTTEWPGVDLFVLDGNGDYDFISRLPEEVSWGIVTALPPASDRPHVMEFGSTMDVVMVNGGSDFVDSTEEGVLNGFNAIYVFKADGQGEVIGHIQVTDLGNNTYRLTDLLRGQRGTEWAMSSLALGDKVILLNRNNMNAFAEPLGNIDVVQTYKAPTSGLFLENTSNFPFTYLGNDFKSWAPFVLSVTDVSGDYVIDWERRANHSGDLTGGGDTVPLWEGTEEYELEILDGPGGSILRTVLALSSSTYTYEFADIETDFGVGMSPAFLTVKVYQISTEVGRGFVNETTLEVV